MQQTDLMRYEERIGCSITDLSREIGSLVGFLGDNAKIIWRVKDAMTLEKKRRLKNISDALEITDIYGIRILVNNKKQVYEVLTIIQRSFSGYLDHDYIKTPKTRKELPGRSLRLLQFKARSNGVTFEIQITTKRYNEKNEELHARYHREKYV